ncbi:MAG: serine O-acetyltransferase [Rhodospirillaceae bacterium]|nr:serine O-acetyltransferase [Rhodospirillaceae bacterium]
MSLGIFKTLRDEIDSMMARDPAARSRIEVVLTYPGFQAVLIHRVAHACWQRGFRLTGRFIANIGRWLTGIEIHPGARIGRRLFIDHGMGVVIGETAEIGDDVTLYHDVTLGGIAPSVNSAAQVNKKRHPTIRDRVIIGSGAQVLGPITVGECARVGANAVVVADVAPRTTVVGIPARVVVPKDQQQRERFVAYGMPLDLPDPVARAIDGLLDQVSRLRARVEALEAGRAGEGPALPNGDAAAPNGGHEGDAERARAPVAQPGMRRIDC